MSDLVKFSSRLGVLNRRYLLFVLLSYDVSLVFIVLSTLTIEGSKEGCMLLDPTEVRTLPQRRFCR